MQPVSPEVLLCFRQQYSQRELFVLFSAVSPSSASVIERTLFFVTLLRIPGIIPFSSMLSIIVDWAKRSLKNLLIPKSSMKALLKRFFLDGHTQHNKKHNRNAILISFHLKWSHYLLHLWNHTRMSTIRSKNHATLTRNFQWKSHSTTPYLSFHLKAFLKTFPNEMKPTKCPAKEKKRREEKRKKRGGEKAKKKARLLCHF